MADMPKMMLKPFRNGYGFELGYGVVSTQTEFGMPRQRLGAINQPHHVSPTYKCTRAMYSYLLSFLRAYRGLPFMAYLLLDDVNHAWYECRFIDERISVTTLGDQIFTVKLSLIVKPQAYDLETDLAFIEIYNMTDGQIDKYFNHLEQLVNVDLPNATQGLK